MKHVTEQEGASAEIGVDELAELCNSVLAKTRLDR